MTHVDADHDAFVLRRSRARAVLGGLLARYGGDDRLADKLELVDGLFVARRDAIGWLTGVSELSVAFAADRPPLVRAMSEVLLRRSLDVAPAMVGLEWGMDMLGRVAAYGAAPYDASLFRELYERLYIGEYSNPLASLRFGMALEFDGASPVLKTYFDLHATQVARRSRIFNEVAETLHQTADLEIWKRMCPGTDFDTSRVIGVDFGAGNAIRTKFYWSGRRLSWQGIAATSREISGDRHVGVLQRLERELMGPATLPSILISMCSVNGVRTLKLDICLARLCDNDGQAQDAIERACGSVVKFGGPAPFDIVSGGLNPWRTRCVVQYFGLELPPDRDPRATIYYRPIGFETEHLNPVLRPRGID